MIIDDADRPAVEGGLYVISYCEAVDGYRHAYADPESRRGRRSGKVRYSRRADHPADPRCPECAAPAPVGGRSHDEQERPDA